MSRNNTDSYRHRTPMVGVANIAGRLGLERTVSLSPERLLMVSGTERLGDGSWRGGFERLCAALQNEAGLNLVGKMAARNHLLQLLRNRLDIEDARDSDTVIGEQRIHSPIFITGLPRSGSTLLHGLLSCDPQLAVPYTWQVMLAGQPPGRDSTHDQARIGRTDSLLAWVHKLAPRFRAIHPMAATLPQECIAITAHEFASVEFHTTFNVPGYQDWLDQHGYATAMQYHHRFVQHLQRYNPERRWVFKAPAHIWALDDILATYPDARFVFTHRNAENVVGSIASHGVVLRNAFSDEVDNEAVARYWLQWWASGWRRARQFRQKTAVPCLDLQYRDLVANPVSCLRGLYEELEIPWTDNLGAKLDAFLHDHSRDKYGKHEYSLADFGLSAEEVRDAFEV